MCPYSLAHQSSKSGILAHVVWIKVCKLTSVTLTDDSSSNISRSTDAFTGVGCPDPRLFDEGSHGNKNRDARGGRRVHPPEFKV